MNTRALIVDDEPLAIQLIESHVSKFDFIEVAGKCKNAFQAINILRKEKIDLLFLDINMPEISGLEFLKSLPNAPYVIITTAYREYALEGFDLNVVDYLLKPISFDRFLKAINKFCERYEKRNTNASDTVFKQVFNNFVYIPDGKIVYKVFLSDILYLEGFGEYVKIHLPGKTILSREAMHEFESLLPDDEFIRIHKSYIVPASKISAFSNISVFLKELELPIGRTYKEAVICTLNYRQQKVASSNQDKPKLNLD